VIANKLAARLEDVSDEGAEPIRHVDIELHRAFQALNPALQPTWLESQSIVEEQARAQVTLWEVMSGVFDAFYEVAADARVARPTSVALAYGVELLLGQLLGVAADYFNRGAPLEEALKSEPGSQITMDSALGAVLAAVQRSLMTPPADIPSFFEGGAGRCSR